MPSKGADRRRRKYMPGAGTIHSELATQHEFPCEEIRQGHPKKSESRKLRVLTKHFIHTGR
jgi:hypothetical protein